MSLIYNGTEVKKLIYNSTEIKTGTYNGIQVFSGETIYVWNKYNVNTSYTESKTTIRTIQYRITIYI